MFSAVPTSEKILSLLSAFTHHFQVPKTSFKMRKNVPFCVLCFKICSINSSTNVVVAAAAAVVPPAAAAAIEVEVAVSAAVEVVAAVAASEITVEVVAAVAASEIAVELAAAAAAAVEVAVVVVVG